MGDHDQLLLESGERLRHQLAIAQVEKGRGLIGHDDRGLDHQHRRQREQLLLPPGQEVARMTGMPGEAERLEHLGDSSSSFLLAHPGAPQGEVHVLRHGGHDDLGVRVGEAEAHPAPDLRALAAGVQAVDRHGARRGDDQPVDHARQRGLAAAVDADDADAALGEGEVDVREDGPVAVGVADSVEADLGAARVGGARAGHAAVERCPRSGAISPGRARCTCAATIAVTTALSRSPGRKTVLAAIAPVTVSSVRMSIPATPTA